MGKKEVIGTSEAFCIVCVFVMGTTLTLSIGSEAGNDAWISVILAFLLAVPFILLYVKILSYCPGKNLFDILESAFGKVLGKIVILLYTWFSFHLGAMILRNFGEFTNIISLPNTPILVPMLVMGLLCTWLVRSGIEVIGRTVKIMIVLVLFFLAIVYLFAIPNFKFNLLQPIFGNPPGMILSSALNGFSFPFAETVVLMGVVFTIDKKNGLKKIYLSGVSLAGFVILLLTVRNIVLLGPRYVESLYFPSYVAVSRIKLGEFVQRIEASVDLVFLTCALIKATACLYACSLGIARLFNLRDYRTIVFQTGLMMSLFSRLVYENVMDMSSFAFKYYRYYAFPFEVVIPLILFIVLTIKKKAGKLDTVNEPEGG